METKKNDELFAAIREAAIDIIDDQVRVTDDLTQVDLLKTIYLLTERITRSKGRLFRINSRGRLVMDSLGRDFLRCVSRLTERPMAELNPYIALAARATDQFMLSELIDEGWATWPVVLQAQQLNNAVSWIRNEARSPRFMIQRAKYQRLSNKNFCSLMQLIDQLQERHAKLLVVRLDLHFSKVARAATSIHHRTLDAQRRAFLRLIQRRYGDALVGFAWKLEYGLERNHHLHTLFAFNGNKIQNDVKIGFDLGIIWQRKITESEGTFYLCNHAKSKYRFCGIGMLEHRDQAKREALNRACLYLTKTDFFVRHRLPDGARMFGKSQVKTKETRGRKRNFPAY